MILIFGPARIGSLYTVPPLFFLSMKYSMLRHICRKKNFDRNKCTWQTNRFYIRVNSLYYGINSVQSGRQHIILEAMFVILQTIVVSSQFIWKVIHDHLSYTFICHQLWMWNCTNPGDVLSLHGNCTTPSSIFPINRSDVVLFSSVPIAQAISLCFARKPERNGKQGS